VGKSADNLARIKKKKKLKRVSK